MSATFPEAAVVLAGDFNTLDNNDIVARALMSIVERPSRGNSSLDRIYVSELSYDSVEVVTSAVKSDHYGCHRSQWTAQQAQRISNLQKAFGVGACSLP